MIQMLARINLGPFAFQVRDPYLWVAEPAPPPINMDPEPEMQMVPDLFSPTSGSSAPTADDPDVGENEPEMQMVPDLFSPTSGSSAVGAESRDTPPPTDLG